MRWLKPQGDTACLGGIVEELIGIAIGGAVARAAISNRNGGVRPGDKAYIGDNATVIGRLATIRASPFTPMTLDSDRRAGVAIGGSVGVGIGADVGAIVKTTEAYIAPKADVTTDGSVLVTADSSENVVSVSVSAGGAGSVAVNVSAGVYVLTVTTRAYIGGGVLDADGAVITADGNVVVAANETASAVITSSNVAGAGTASTRVGQHSRNMSRRRSLRDRTRRSRRASGRWWRSYRRLRDRLKSDPGAWAAAPPFADQAQRYHRSLGSWTAGFVEISSRFGTGRRRRLKRGRG